MLANKLNKKIQIQNLSLDIDSDGYDTETWTTVIKCWASIKQDDTQQQDDGQTFTDQTRFTVQIRYRNDISTQQRILWDNYTIEINSIKHDINKRITTIKGVSYSG